MDRKNIEAVYPLSPIQQGILFHCLYAPESGLYFEQLSCTLRGPFNVPAFQRAWQRVADRHPVLRTAFVWEGSGDPLQVVGRRVRLPWESHDWRGLPYGEQTERLESFLQSDRDRGFKFSKAPLTRLSLIQTAEDVYQFVWSFHHLLLDGWSVPLLLKEVFAFYEAFCRGQDLHQEPTRPYGDYIAWLQRQDLDRAETYWRQALKGFSAPTPLHVDRTPPSGSNQKADYSEQRIRLSKATTAALRSLTRRHYLTLNTLAQGAWALLLSRYSGEDDVVFGTVVSGRPPDLAGVESMIGLFINTLPVRVQVPPTDSLLPWLKKLQDQQAEMRQYEHSPLVQVQGWSEVPRGLPLFTSIFIFENYPTDAPLRKPGSGLKVENVRYIERTNYPLTLVANPGSEWSLRVVYNRERFNAETVARMLEHLRTLLEGIAANPEHRLSDLPLLPESEWRPLMTEWNNPPTDHLLKDSCLPRRFEIQAQQTPEAVAVVCEGEHWTYGGLNRRANRLAHRLRALGVAPEVLVGLYTERSVELVVGILGILKAGGAYLPLDPTYPRERLAFMLEDAQAPVLVTQERLLANLPAHTAKVVCLDSDRLMMAEESPENPTPQAVAENLAYVIYTSGSTGRPKGVLIEHAQVTRLFTATEAWFGFGPHDVWTLFHSTAFDFSVWELWGALLYGGRLVIVSYWESRSPEAFRALLNREGVTVLNQTPSAFAALQEADRSAAPSAELALRWVIFGGEALEPARLRPWFDRHGEMCPRLVNMYGITETTVHVTYRPLGRADAERAAVSAIGGPIPDLRMYALDGHRRLVPAGVPGELYVGGAGLARGYLNRPELTAERFVPDPFGDGIRTRLYRTGDLARYDGNGDFEYLGRVDHQVKLRGFRIELSEIEATLARHPSVWEAVVVAREDASGGRRLVAYVVANEGQTPAAHELRHYVKERLPDYMVPSAFVMLDRMPRTPTGKVDRKALPAAETDRPALEETFVAPRTPVEDLLTGIWAQVLGLREVGRYDNFFALGGHSLLATQIIARAQETFRVPIPLRTLFEEPTVVGMAGYIERTRPAMPCLPAAPIQPVSRGGNLPLSFAQQRLWFLHELDPTSPFYNIHAAMRLNGSLDIAALEQSINKIIRRHDALRTTFTASEGRPFQVIHPALRLRIPVVSLEAFPEHAREAETRRLADEEIRRPFDLTQGPLLRVRLLRTAPGEHVLLLTMHHIVADGWSLGVFFRELSILYKAFSTGEPPQLPELPVQYADFARWQWQWLSGAVLEAQLSYWRRQLQGAPTVLHLPLDRPRPAVQTFRGAYQSLVLPRTLSESIKALSREVGATLFMVLLAAFKVLLYRYTGQEDLVVGTPVANRGRAEVEGLIGCFVNTLVLRTDVSGDPSFHQLLARVREVALEAYAHQELPFEKLVKELHPERDLSYAPLFQVWFVEHNVPVSSPELHDVTLRPLSLDKTVTNLDLTLAVKEKAGRIVLQMGYSTDLFDAATITRMLGHFEILLQGIAIDPKRRISTLPLLTQTELRQARGERQCGLGVDYEQDRHVPQLFEAQVARTPDAVAVVFEDEQVTYYELNRRANQLARYLRARGVGPDVLVGVYMERSLEIVVGLLGILKAGGAYLPMDPMYPEERLAFMLEDARPRGLLTQRRLRATLPAGASVLAVACLDSDWPTMGQERGDNLARTAHADNLAYAIYTSGSAGKPKGVLVSNGSLVNHCIAMQKQFELNSNDRVLQFASINFDVSLEQILPGLCRGARLVLRDTEWSPADFHKKLLDFGLTVANLPPAYWHPLTQAWSGETELIAHSSLRLMIVGGEAMSPESVALWRQTPLRSVRLLNAYGPTEATITGTVFEISPAYNPDSPWRRIPIGRPLAHRTVYVLDRAGSPAPVGITGELHIAGPLLARGYLGRPELTAERFIPDSFSGEMGARLYKTGDLACYRPDGNLEFVGRADHQVKIRGFRIELEEVEAVLGEHPAVEQAVAVAREDAAGSKRLVAYIVANQEPAPTTDELRGFLLKKLPQYMLPSTFVFLDAMPLMPNGKVNRHALPAPAPLCPEEAAAADPPRTPAEVALAAIWSHLLGSGPVGRHDNFFERGGDSILALQVVARARATGLRLTPRQLFQHQTIAELAASAEWVVDPSGRPAAAASGPETGSLPLTPIQRWFLESDPADPHYFNQALLLEGCGPLDPARLGQALRRVLAHHDALRLRFARGPAGWQAWHAETVDDGPLLTCVDLSALPEPAQGRALAAAAAALQASLDLRAGPLGRAAFFKRDVGRPGRLLLIVHHLAIDGVSWRILLEDLQAAYEQLGRDQAVTLPPKTTTFKRWAERLVEYAASPALRSEAAYWLAESGRPTDPLPVDFPGGANTVMSARTVTIGLSADETRALLQKAPAAHHVQINDLLLTALAHALVPAAGGRGLWVDLEGHGREDLFEDIDLSRTVGWFTTLFPVRLTVVAGYDPEATLKTVKEHRRRLPNRGLGYGLLRYLSKDAGVCAALTARSSADVSFNYLGQFDQILSGAALFRTAGDSGPSRSRRGHRSHRIEINGLIRDGRLSLAWTYSENVHRRSTVEGWAQRFLEVLRELIRHEPSAETTGYTPSDFPLVRLDQQKLDRLIGEDRQIIDLYPLSPMQQGMLFHELYAPEATVYLNQLICTLRGDLNVSAFEQAWQRVIDRHTVLRTSFRWKGFEEPLQAVHASARPAWEQHEWRGLSPAEQSERLRSLLQADRDRGFELSQAPLMRLILIRIAEHTYRLVWSKHHLLLDGWSTSLLLEEVLTFYEALRRGQDVHLQNIRPYRDYIAWLERQDWHEAQAFWQRALKGFKAPTPLGIGQTTGRLPAGQATDDGDQYAKLSADATAALRSMAQRYQLTLNTVVQGAWALLLSRCSGEQDVVFGTVVSGRPADLIGADAMVGLFINTLPVRVSVPPEGLLRPWLKQLQIWQAEMRQYEYSPLVQVQGCSEVPRRWPLFESILAFENYPIGGSPREQDPSLEIRYAGSIEKNNYPLTVMVAPGATLSMRALYDGRRFDASVVRQMMEHFKMLLEWVATHPDGRLDNIPFPTGDQADRQNSYQHDQFVF